MGFFLKTFHLLSKKLLLDKRKSIVNFENNVQLLYNLALTSAMTWTNENLQTFETENLVLSPS